MAEELEAEEDPEFELELVEEGAEAEVVDLTILGVGIVLEDLLLLELALLQIATFQDLPFIVREAKGGLTSRRKRSKTKMLLRCPPGSCIR